MDVYPGWSPTYACATSNPGLKSADSRRLSFTVMVPDEFVTGKISAVLPVYDIQEADADT